VARAFCPAGTEGLPGIEVVRVKHVRELLAHLAKAEPG